MTPPPGAGIMKIRGCMAHQKIFPNMGKMALVFEFIAFLGYDLLLRDLLSVNRTHRGETDRFNNETVSGILGTLDQHSSLRFSFVKKFYSEARYYTFSSNYEVF